VIYSDQSGAFFYFHIYICPRILVLSFMLGKKRKAIKNEVFYFLGCLKEHVI
jgi:hypothetical protein